MLKKFFALTILLLMMSATCAAVTFCTPAEIGSVSMSGDNKLKIQGATAIDSDGVTGTATFGELYLHFDGAALERKMRVAKTSDDMLKIYNEVSFFGGRDVKNSVPHFVFEGLTKISRIPNDAGLKLYLLATETGGGGSMTVIGERDGKWVKFFDTNDARKTYGIGRDFYLMNLQTAGSEIIFSYSNGNGIQRELRYRWDTLAQWFAVGTRD